jgi:hypothetical protein
VFCEDAQVLRMCVMPGLHAYVHYLTLHDPVARGFVRPLCLAYVTADQYKLSQMFPKLRKEFLQASIANIMFIQQQDVFSYNDPYFLMKVELTETMCYSWINTVCNV